MYTPLPHPRTRLFIVTVCLVSNAWAQPKITSFMPASASVGTVVTITGTNFSASPAGNHVFFGAVKAAVTGASSTILSVTVPAGATYAPLSVLNTASGLTGYSSQSFVPTFINPFGTGIPNNFYFPKIDLATGNNASYVAAGDLDGDGKPDLVFVVEGEGTMYVLRNISFLGSVYPSSFAASVSFSIGNGGGRPVIGDVDGDGRPDVVVTNGLSNSVIVFRNLSTPGSFTPASLAAGVPFLTGTETSYVALGDIDGDGKTDLVTSNRSGNSVSVLRNTSTPGSITTASFAGKIDFATDARPNSVALGDIDGDGKPDIATANTLNSTLSVLRNTSSPGSITAASFAAKTDFTTGHNPFFAAIGDLDGDGKADLVAANASEANVSVLRNTSSGGSITAASFAGRVNFATGNFPITLAISDADGDGKPDVVVANREQRFFSVLRNLSSGNITAASFAPKIDFYVSGLPNDVVIFDIDGDGLPEVATANALSTPISVVKIAAPEFPPVITSFTPASGPAGTTVTIKGAHFFSAAIYNTVYFGAAKATVLGGSDSSLTVTVPAGATYQPISVMSVPTRLTGYSAKPFTVTFPNPFGSGIPPGFYAPRTDFATGMLPYAVAMADLDGDSKNDLVVINAQSNSVSVLRNTGTAGSSLPVFAPRVNFATGTDPRAVVVKDVDADGRPDIIVLNSASSTISVLRNNSIPGNIAADAFAPKVDFAVGPVTYPYSIAVDDMDNDGRPDLLVANLLSGAVGILRNTSASVQSSGFADREDFVVGVYPRSIATCDLDGDGKRDLAVANERSNTVSVLRNITITGYAFQFAGKVDFPIGTNPPSIAAGDVDGDGRPDLVVANYASNNLSVLRNTSTPGSITGASFAPKVDFATGTNPFCVALGDADGDGKVDLVTANANANTVSVLRNTSTPGSIGAASFAGKVDFASTGYPMYIAMGDLTGDGIPEIAAANGGANTVSVFRVNAPLPAASGETASASAITMTVYPNPAKGALNLQVLNLRAPGATLEVFNDKGRVVYRQVLPVAENGTVMQTKLNLYNQPAGIYYIKASGINGVSVVKTVWQP